MFGRNRVGGLRNHTKEKESACQTETNGASMAKIKEWLDRLRP